LPLRGVLILRAVSLLFIELFVRCCFYRSAFNGHALEYGKSVLSIYLVSLAVVGALVTVIRQALSTSNALLAIEQVMTVALPASTMSASSQRMPLNHELSRVPGGT
jgi:hypothetical protein